MEKLLCSGPTRIQASKGTSNFAVRENCALCFTSSLTLQFPSRNYLREQGFTCKGRDYRASEPCASKPAKVLQIAWYTRIANSFVLSVSHLHSQSVGAPTVYVLVDSSCCQYCYVTLYLVWVPNWFVNSCRLRVQLQEWRPCIQHQDRRLSRQAARCIGLHENSHVAWANMRKCLTTRTSRASSRRALNHCCLFWTSCTWTWSALCRAFLVVSIVTLSSCMISYLISLILHMKVCDMCSDIIELWYHIILISKMQGHDIICDIIQDINIDIKDIGYDIIELWCHIILIS